MTNIFDKTSNIFLECKARKQIWLVPLIIFSLITIEWKYLLLSFVLYSFFRGIIFATYHDYVIHRVIKPKNKIIEIIGWYIISVWEWTGPRPKVMYHCLHHMYDGDKELDPTEAKLSLTNSMAAWLFDLSPHAPITVYPEAEALMNRLNKTEVYLWFDKYWKHCLILTVICWLIFLPFWTFLAFLIWPNWSWTMIYKFTEWRFHKQEKPDNPWLAILLGCHAWHESHHLDRSDTTTYKIYYGSGIIKYLNTDWYVHKLLYKPYH